MLASTQVGQSLSDVPTDARLDVWRVMCRETFLGDLVWTTESGARGAAAFSGSIKRRWIDDILFVESEASRYSASYANDSEADEYIGFGFSRSFYGEQLTMRDSSSINLRSQTCLWANSSVRRYDQMSAGRSMVLHFPKKVLRAYAGSAVDRLRLVMDLESPATRVMCAMISAVRDETDDLGIDESLALRNSLIELMTSIVADRDTPPIETAAVSSMMKRRVLSWIDSNIHLGPVSPSQVAAAHGISTRSLQRLFADESGSFSDAVRNARVSRARHDVISTGDSLQSIAMRWGFADPSHFSREFRKCFGTTPSELRSSTVVQLDPVGSTTIR